MMINRIKKLLLYKSGTTKLEKNDVKLQQEETLRNKKKKRFSLLLKAAMIEPNEMATNKDMLKKKQISKSSSFLQLQTSTVTPIKRSRSMFGQFYSNEKSTSPTNEKDQSAAILDYYAASTTAVSENILHTAAVSISSVYNTMSSSTLKCYETSIGSSDSNEQSKYLQLGTQFYEKGELEQASYYWRLAIESNQPSSLGNFFYGLSLRHGWGCRKSPALALSFLQKAAEYPVIDLQSGITRLISEAKIDSIVLSIYELGDFFWHGWEVPKNATIASYYFRVASNMGNTDAMNDLAFCYKHGHGVEKDDVKAAQLYRQAETKGNGLTNNSWIWEGQYDLSIENTTL
ncbi:unnamed protein product [Mucor hiemalis]